ncbi:MAG: ATP-binding cassette domain-containing protein, partial [Exiguobacterium profundum]
MHIQLKGIHKSFGPVSVLKGVDFELLPGEIHALMGENGAGKSTLMKVMTGLHAQDEGEILIDGAKRQFKHPKEAEQEGIAFIHQELNILPEMTVTE